MQRVNVGVAKVTLRLWGSASLKDRRRVVNSICQRVHNKFSVSIADVGPQDTWQTAVLGISCTSNSVRHAEQTLDTVVSFIESERPDAQMVDCEIETLTGF